MSWKYLWIPVLALLGLARLALGRFPRSVSPSPNSCSRISPPDPKAVLGAVSIFLIRLDFARRFAKIKPAKKA